MGDSIMTKISKIVSPAIAGVIREKSTKSVIAEIKNCMYDGADMIDVHMSCMEKTDVETLKQVVASTSLPILALNYNMDYNWQDAGLSEEERIATFERAIEAGVAGIDIQGYTFDLNSKNGFCGEDKYSFTKNNPKEIVTDEKIISKQCELIEKAHFNNVEVLLSCHPGIPMNCQQVVDLALFMEKRNPDIIKIVTAATNDDELFESIRTIKVLKKELKIPVSFHTNGSCGALSRVVNPALGGHIAFCVDRFNEGSTMEQLDLKTAKIIIDNLKKVL